MEKLCIELTAFLDAYGLAQQSSDEVLCTLFATPPADRDELTWLQIGYLENFGKRWNIAQASEA